MTDQTEPEDTCRTVEIDGETIRVRGAGELTDEDREALASVVQAAKAKFTQDAPEQVGVLQNRLQLAHKARRAKEHQLDDIRRALCDIGFMQDDDPYSHADLADVIRQNGQPATEATETETTARVSAGLHRSAEQDVTRVIELYERWVKEGAPPLGIPIARWWDKRLVELHDAIRPADDQPKEQQ
ncbi:hypothetical protein ACIBAC_11410 [Streptomyces sp. NPDC051362]|uniref:hypothetical protein n=1 Tax=Streptomyces sp. NPDC051362 TaxID=3365651 RepID=UPI0037A7EAD5